MDKIIFKANDLCLSFGGVEAVKNFSMELHKGEIRGIIGPNGAGKTTIFNIISRIYNQDRGTLEFDGLAIDAMDQIKVALDWAAKYSVFEALFLLPRRFRYEKETRERAMECLNILGLESYAKQNAASLPYGIQRRVEIARALVSRPRVLMLDEPAAGLNTEEVFQLIDFINGIVKRERELAILVIEHRMDLIMNLCSYIYVQDFGITIAGGTPAEVQSNPAVLTAYLGEEEK
jgi:ABC-type branched-subunit amino acid transport system ATPase component